MRTRGVVRAKSIATEACRLAVNGPAFVERGVWLRPFGDIVYLAPPLNIAPADLAALTAAVVTGGGVVLLLAAGHYLLLREQVWLQTVSPALMLFMGHAVLTAERLTPPGYSAGLRRLF